MNERIQQELALLRHYYPDTEYREAGEWILLPHYRMPTGIWDHDEVSVAFQIPTGYPANKPYGFHIRPRVLLKDGRSPNNCAPSSEPPFGGDWLKFSWDVPGWRPTADLQTGNNLWNFVLTVAERLKEGA